MNGDASDARQRYLVIETYREGPVPVYRRLRRRGRRLPDGVRHVSSWVTEDLERCYQVVECSRREALQRWMNEWRDLVDFEIHPVLTSEEAEVRAIGKRGG